LIRGRTNCLHVEYLRASFEHCIDRSVHSFINMAAASVSALPSGASSMAAEAQRLMALSVNKIVASRSRRGGISLHRNLLVAGVLFRARDALLAAGKMPSLSSSSSSSSQSTSPSSGSSSAPEKQRQQPDQAAEDSSRSSSLSSGPASSSTEASAMHQSQSDAHSESSASETGTFQGQESSPNTNDDAMDVDIVGKENVPPPTPAVVQPTVTAEFSKPAAETDDAKEYDDGLKQRAVSAARKRHCSEMSTACPIVKKSTKTCSSPSSTSTSSSAADSRNRSSSVPSCTSRVSSKRVAVSPKSSSSSGRSTAAVSPVVYLNRVDVAFCSTPGIGGGIIGSIRPVLVVQVV
jgi:hypothetical protein